MSRVLADCIQLDGIWIDVEYYPSYKEEGDYGKFIAPYYEPIELESVSINDYNILDWLSDKTKAEIIEILNNKESNLGF